jgi:hypothetical protein
MAYTFSIELPTDEIETLFHDLDDDHAAVPSVAYENSTWIAKNNNKHHNEFVDMFVSDKIPANRIRQYNIGKEMQGKRNCYQMDIERRERYAHRANPRFVCDTQTFIQSLIDA